MTKEETLRVLAILKAAYPSSYNGMTKREAEGTVGVWYMQLADVPVDIVLMAVQKLISTNKFPPAISEVKDKLTSIHWEASDALTINSGKKALSKEAEARYRQIYEQTIPYAHKRMAEPSICYMIASNNLALGSGDK